MPRYRVETWDGDTHYIPVDDTVTGPNVYDVGMGSDGELTHYKREDEQRLVTPEQQKDT